MYAIKIDNISKTYRIYKKPFKRVLDLVFGKKNYTEYKALKKKNLNSCFSWHFVPSEATEWRFL